METDALGQVTVARHFDPFGVPLGADGGSPFGYTGEQWDAGTGLVFLRARYYDPETGAFLSRDQVEGEPPYAYARGNPVNLTDPSGRSVCDGWSGRMKNFCLEAENGNLEAIEGFYRAVVIRNRLERLPVSADFLKHYLDGTTTPGEPRYIWAARNWYLQSAEVDRVAYQGLILAFINEHLGPAAESCNYSNPIQADMG